MQPLLSRPARAALVFFGCLMLFVGLPGAPLPALDGAVAAPERVHVARPPRFIQVAAGSDYDCALRMSGSVICWGYLPKGLPAGSGRMAGPHGKFKSISVGSFTGCGIRRHGAISCWQDGPVLPVLRPPRGRFRQVSVGGGGTTAEGVPPPEVFYGHPFACAITIRRRLRCWGDDAFRQAEPPTGRFVQVSAGQTAACAVRVSKRLACWGQGAHRSLKPPAGRFLQVSLGDTQAASFDFQVAYPGSYACAISADHRLTCWGGDSGYRPYAQPPPGSFIAISAGDEVTCGISAQKHIDCWGYYSPADWPLPKWKFSHVAVGEVVCGVRARSGALACGYDNEFGESEAFTGPARQISGDFSSSSGSGCVLHVSGRADCWGTTINPQTNAPGLTDGPASFTQVSVSGAYACGTRPNGSLKCWGIDATDGAGAPPAGNFARLSVGDNDGGYGCAIRGLDHSLRCWPSSFVNGWKMPSGGFREIRLSQTQSLACGLRVTGTLACWNTDPQVADTSGVTRPPSGRFIHVSLGGNFYSSYACALRTDRTVVCWGDDHDGIRDGPSARLDTVVAGSNLFADYACGIRPGGALACWGSPGGPYAGQTAGPPPAGRYLQVIAGQMPCALTRAGTLVICWSQGGEVIPLD